MSVYREYQIVPDVVETFSPTFDLRIFYDEGEVLPGNEVSPEEASNEPIVEFNGDPSIMYTLVMVDPDAPSSINPFNRYVRHWLVSNIVNLDVMQGDVFTSYHGPTPPPGSGYHRYVFLLYEQSAPLRDYINDTNRARFDLQEFVFLHDLGEPVAINFFLSRSNITQNP